MPEGKDRVTSRCGGVASILLLIIGGIVMFLEFFRIFIRQDNDIMFYTQENFWDYNKNLNIEEGFFFAAALSTFDKNATF